MTTVLGTAKQQTTATAKSVLEKLKSLTSSVSRKATENAGEFSQTIGAETAKISEEISENSTLYTIFIIIRYILAFLILGFVLLNILSAIELLPQSFSRKFSILLYYLLIILLLRRNIKNHQR